LATFYPYIRITYFLRDKNYLKNKQFLLELCEKRLDTFRTTRK